MLRRIRSLGAALALVSLCLPLLVQPAAAQTSFVAFESGPVRPLAMSPDGNWLFAVNTPDNQLEVFLIGPSELVKVRSIPVGMEPVAVAAPNNTHVWVVNHLSDSVSIVDFLTGRVVQTLLVGDEPRDIVFAGSPQRAFITTAHRGQHRTHASISAVPGAGDPQLTTEGIGRADVWVFDATSPGTSIGGDPEEILTFFADTPRALAVAPDGNTVYAAAFHSGNQTTVITEAAVPDGFDNASTTTSCPAGGTAPGGVPGPDDNAAGDPAPETGLIVKFDGAAWRDAAGRDWSGCVNLNLPDHDVFSIDGTTLAAGSVNEFDHVGTILFNMVVNPVSGKVYVTNLEMPNHVRFEGPGVHGGSTVQGHLSESRITVIDPVGATVDPQHLNQHIDYTKLHTDGPGVVDTTQVDHSLATPLQPVVNALGTKLYVAAFGSGKVGVFDTADIEDPAFETNFDPTSESANYLDVPGGPSGLVLDEAKNRLYVATRFDNSVAVVDLGAGAEVHRLPLMNPEPATVRDGRPVLYDAVLTSGNGEASCSSCHIFGDFDSLAWNLGDPDHAVTSNSQPIATPLLNPDDPSIFAQVVEANTGQNSTTLHPMKGPMTTQTLRGMSTHGALHWRGDRVDGFFGDGAGGAGPDPCNEPGYVEVMVGDTQNVATTAPCSEDLSFRNFIVAFEGLVGHDGVISTADMQRFADFILEVQLPPNPVTPLDNTYVGDFAAGESVFFTCGPGTDECPHDQVFAGGGTVPGATDTVDDCDGCHNLDPLNGFFGTGGEQTFENEPQNFKVAHMRNMYQKVGMFGTSGDNTFEGDQVRGVGFLHDGSIDTIFHFLTLGSAFPGLNPGEPEDLEQFSMAFPTDLAPVVGQQVTLVGAGDGVINARIDLLIARAGTPFDSKVLGGAVTECDLVVKGTLNGEARGWWYQPGTGNFQSDRSTETHTDAEIRAFATVAGQEMTYTCVPPGSGGRVGIDRDEDGEADRDELDAGTDPANAGSILGACTDGIDNDGDGDTDGADAGCVGGGTPDIENPACDDGIDNDADGLFDLAGDPACQTSASNSERSQCQDGLNNDGQIGTDFDGGISVLGVGNGDPNGADPECVQAWTAKESTGGGGPSCGLGAELVVLLPAAWALRSRRRRSRMAS